MKTFDKEILLFVFTLFVFFVLGMSLVVPFLDRRNIEAIEALESKLPNLGAQALSYSVRYNANDRTPITKSTPTYANWDTELYHVGTDITYSAGNFTLKQGKYFITYSDHFYNTSTTNNERIQGIAYITLNDSAIDAGSTYFYIRRSNGQLECMPSGQAIINIPNDNMKLGIQYVRLDNTADSISPLRVEGYGGISILKLDDDWDAGIYNNTAQDTSVALNNFQELVLNNNVEEDPNFSRSGNNVTVTDRGKYLVAYTVLSYTGSGRTEGTHRLVINDTEVPGTRVNNYVRDYENDDDGACSWAGVVHIGPSSTIRVEVSEEDGVYRLDPGSGFQIVQLPSATKSFRAYSANGDMNPSALTEFQWDTEDFKSSDTFSFTAGNTYIDVDEPGTYLFLSSLGDTNGGSRIYPTQQYSINDTLVNGVMAGSYGRNSGGSDHAGHSTATIINCSSADQFSVEVQQYGNSGATGCEWGSVSAIRLDDILTDEAEEEKSWVQNTKGWFTYNNNQNFTQNSKGHFLFNNNQNYTQNSRGFVTFKNNQNFTQNSKGFFLFFNNKNYTQNSKGFFTFLNNKNYSQNSKGFFTFLHNQNFSQDSKGWFRFYNNLNYSQNSRGHFSFGNNQNYSQNSRGFFTFLHNQNYTQSKRGWFTFSNDQNFTQSKRGFFKFSNNLNFTQSSKGWVTFASNLNFSQSTLGFFTFSNNLNYSQDSKGWFTFGNNLNFTQTSRGWFTFENNLNFTLSKKGHFLFLNNMNYSTDKAGWFTFSNNQNYTQTDKGFFSFNNNLNYTQNSKGWFVFENEQNFSQNSIGWFTYSNNQNFTQNNKGWFRFNNNLNYSQNSRGYFTFLNNKNFSQNSRGYFTFNNNLNFTQSSRGFFLFRNDKNYSKEKIGFFSFSNNMNYSQNSKGWFNFSSTGGWGVNSTGFFTFMNNMNYSQSKAGHFTFSNNMNFSQNSRGFFSFSHNQNFSRNNAGYFTFQNNLNHTQNSLGFFSFNNNLNFTQNSLGFFNFGHNQNFTTDTSGWFRFKHNINFTQNTKGWFNFTSGAGWDINTSGFFRFENNLNHTQQVLGFFTFQNDFYTHTNGHFTFWNNQNYSGTTAWFRFLNNRNWTQSNSGWFNFSNISYTIDVWFTYNVNGGLVTCQGYYTGTMTEFAWNTTSAYSINTGTTGWVAYTGQNLAHNLYSDVDDVVEITFSGKNNHTDDNQTRFIEILVSPPSNDPTTEDFYAKKQPTSYDLVIGGYVIDSRALFLLVVLILVSMGVAVYMRQIGVRKKKPPGLVRK